MINFKYLFHKKTKQHIDYNRWLDLRQQQNELDVPMTVLFYNKSINTEPYHYYIDELIFSDDFDIIYDEPFTESDMFQMLNELPYESNIRNKIKNHMIDNRKLEEKYGVRL